ncbi:MAG: hypothetical protein C4337_01225 [Armatimonadota bacterium]
MFLLIVFIERFLKDYGFGEREARRAGWLAVGLFIVIPAHGEAIIWIASRADVNYPIAKARGLRLARLRGPAR